MLGQVGQANVSEIEVTEEMIEAGIGALYGEVNGWDEATRAERRRALAAVFAAMWRESKTIHSLSGNRLIASVRQSLPSSR